MAATHYDSRGGLHFSESSAQVANRHYAHENREVQRLLLLTEMITAEESTRLREEQERQNARQQSHNQEMEQLESAKLEAQRQQIQYQKDVACLEGEPVATRAEYLVKRALEDVQLPFDDEAFELRLNGMFGVMAEARLVDLMAQATKARTAHQTAWQETCMTAAEAAALEPNVHRTQPKSPLDALGWYLAVLSGLSVASPILSVFIFDGNPLPGLWVPGSFLAVGLPILLFVVIRGFCKLPQAKRAHKQAQKELMKAIEQKHAAQETEAAWKAEVEKADRQVAEEFGRLKEKLIEHFHTKSHEEFIRAQHPLPSFSEFVWLRVSQFQEDLPPRCRVTRDSVTVDLCEAQYPVLLDQAVSKSVKRVKTARLDSEKHTPNHDDGFAVTLDEW